MKINERIELLKAMLVEGKDKLAILLPTATIEILLETYNESLKAMEKVEKYKKMYHQERSQARYYKNAYLKQKEINDTLKGFDSKRKGAIKHASHKDTESGKAPQTTTP